MTSPACFRALAIAVMLELFVPEMILRSAAEKNACVPRASTPGRVLGRVQLVQLGGSRPAAHLAVPPAHAGSMNLVTQAAHRVQPASTPALVLRLAIRAAAVGYLHQAHARVLSARVGSTSLVTQAVIPVQPASTLIGDNQEAAQLAVLATTLLGRTHAVARHANPVGHLPTNTPRV